MIANTTTTMLRSGVARTCSLQPILLRSGTTSTTSSSSSSTSPYSTFPSSPFFARSKLLSSPATATTGKPNSILILRASQQQPQTTTPSRRHASNSPKTNDDTITASSSAHAEDAAAAARSAQRATEAAALSGAPPLDWETFFKLRKSRRRLQVGFSVVTSLVSATLGGGVLGSGLADPLTSQLPLDPYMTMGLFTTGFLALGWLAGPSLGSTVFYLMNRKYKVPMTAKESQLFARIKKNRVDPSNSSTGNPVPDFYGEKISSVAGYRQWLRDQKAFNKKRANLI